MKLLEHKVAVISGGARGIGAGIARILAQHGAHIAFSFVSNSSIDAANALVNELETNHIKAKCYQSNAADYKQSESWIQDVLKDFGTIDICINNAGIAIDNLILRLSVEQWQETQRTNLDSVFNITKHVIKPMLKARSGSIINISSIIGIKGNAGQSAYAASKAGIIGFTKSIALELASRNIRCNAIAPGFIETDMTKYLKEKPDDAKNLLTKIPLNTFGTPTDIGNACLYLGSHLSQYVTGQVISVCGGMNI